MSGSSSPDPLILPMESSPIRGSRSRRFDKGPLSSRSINITSPSKTMYLESNKDENGSPWRIKVTVQAEPPSPEINRSVMTRKVPLKDAQTSSPTRRPARRAKKAASSPTKGSPRKPTPPRRRKSSLKSHDLIAIPDDPTNDYSLSEIEPTPARLAHGDSQTSTNDLAERPRPSSNGERHSLIDLLKASEQQDVVSSNVPSVTSPGFPTEDWSDNEDAMPGPGAPNPGDATVLESEEFSMISVDSLSSNARVNDHLSPSASYVSSRPAAKDRSAEVSWLPSSPPAYPPAPSLTPLPSDSPLQHPAAPVQVAPHHESVETPLQESARKSGRALQDVVTGPFRASSNDSVFAGFSAGTRRQLRESLYAGQHLATPELGSRANFGLGLQGVPHMAAPVPTFSSPFHSPVRRNSNSASHRLPTPDDKSGSSNADTSTEPAGEVQYPSLTNKSQTESFLSPTLKYDDMSWVATGATGKTPLHRSPLRHSATQSELGGGLEASQDSNHQPGATTIIEATTEQRCQLQQQESHEGTSQDDDEASKDIWQEEASRSIDDDCDDDTPPLMREDLPIKPRRSKLPRTWRRTSAANFSYSDSPEPEDLTDRKVSAATSASGIMTPPVTEDEGVHAETATPDTGEKGGQMDGGEGSKSASELLSPIPSSNSCVSSDGEDTGVFWQANLPSVFNRPGRGQTRRARTELPSATARNIDTSLQVDGSFSVSSPLGISLTGFSPNKAEQSRGKFGAAKRSPQSDSILMPTPLRQSLLRTSKLRSTPPGSPSTQRLTDASCDESLAPSTNGARDEPSAVNVTSSSLASDARQLHNELTQHSGVGRNTAVVDLTQASSSETSQVLTETDISQSYVEELNRDSPMRVRVNFNDSSTHETTHEHDSNGRSLLLSPKKQYPPLFDNVPSLKPSKDDGKGAEGSSAEARDRPRIRKDGFVSRLTESFWEAVTAPPQYVDSKPTIVISPSPSPAPASFLSSQGPSSGPGASIPDHVLRLRRKYGLLPHTHPFTYQHVRTLHRMLNSTRSRGSRSSILPTSGPLPPDLQDLVGRTKTNELDQKFTWTPKYAHVVASFMALLLPFAERQRLVEHTGKDWGDEETLRYKGLDSKGRHGSDKVYSEELSGKIESLWVAGIVQDIIWKEEMNARKKRVQELLAKADRAERLEKVQRA